MELFLLIGLALGLGAVLLGDHGEDPNEEENLKEEDYPIVPEAYVNGTDENDTLISENDYTQIAAGAGDDEILFNPEFNFSLLLGEDGDDTINGILTDELHGGAGDDLLIADLSIYNDSANGVLDGGAVNDTLYAFHRIYPSYLDIGEATLTGGSGSDTIELDLLLDKSITVFDSDGTPDLDMEPITTGITIDGYNAEDGPITVNLINMTDVQNATATPVLRDNGFELTLTNATTQGSVTILVAVNTADGTVLSLDDIVVSIENNPATVQTKYPVPNSGSDSYIYVSN